jgi:hypothetical protein
LALASFILHRFHSFHSFHCFHCFHSFHSFHSFTFSLSDLEGMELGRDGEIVLAIVIGVGLLKLAYAATVHEFLETLCVNLNPL